MPVPGIASEINTFMDELNNVPVVDETPVVDPPAETPVEPAIEVEVPVEPPVEPPAVETPAPAAEPTSDEIIASLREQILALSAERGIYPEPPQPAAEVTTGAPADTTQPPQTAPLPVSDIQKTLQTIIAHGGFLTDDELDKVIDEPQLINAAIQRSNEKVTTGLISILPAIIQNEVKKQTMINLAVQEFYTENADLRPYAKFVQHIFAELEGKETSLTYGELFERAAADSRKRLGLKNPATQEVTRDRAPDNPGFAGTKNTNRRPSSKPDINPDMADIIALHNHTL